MNTILYSIEKEIDSFNYQCSYEVPSNFRLHNHKDCYEVLIFVKGDTVFNVEGNEYKPDPWDVFIVNPKEMHRMCLNSPCIYERYVFHICGDFFIRNDCLMFRDMFLNRPLGINNLIAGDDNIKSLLTNMANCVLDKAPETVTRSILIQLLYALYKKADVPTNNISSQTRINKILQYINDNLTTPINLDIIAEEFFLNKHYLCHFFKKNTGYTVNKYVNYKRLLLARELCSSGLNLIEASESAGFGNYSVFYKMYKREFGETPRNYQNKVVKIIK